MKSLLPKGTTMKFKEQARLFKARRLKKKFTQRELAKKLHVHTQLVSNWERGVCEVPWAKLKRTCAVLEVDRDEVQESKLADNATIVLMKIKKNIG